jgi:hypothetical protein
LANERTRALNAIGLNQVLAAMPQEWWPLIESIIAARHATPVVTTSPNTSDNLEIPTFLRRDPLPALVKSETMA